MKSIHRGRVASLAGDPARQNATGPAKLSDRLVDSLVIGGTFYSPNELADVRAPHVTVCVRGEEVQEAVLGGAERDHPRAHEHVLVEAQLEPTTKDVSDERR